MLFVLYSYYLPVVLFHIYNQPNHLDPFTTGFTVSVNLIIIVCHRLIMDFIVVFFRHKFDLCCIEFWPSSTVWTSLLVFFFRAVILSACTGVLDEL